MSLQFTHVRSSVAKLSSRLFYCWSLLRSNNLATNLQRFTSVYGIYGGRCLNAGLPTWLFWSDFEILAFLTCSALL